MQYHIIIVELQSLKILRMRLFFKRKMGKTGKNLEMRKKKDKIFPIPKL